LGEDQTRTLALRAYVAGLQGLDDYLEIYLDRELLPGYAWVFPAGDGTANVGVGVNQFLWGSKAHNLLSQEVA